MNIYVGNLSYDVTEDEVRELFAQHGEIDSVKMINDRDTGRPKGFCFVEMPQDEQADSAIEALNESEVKGRPIKVNKARPRESGGGRRGGPPRRGGGGKYGGGGGGGGYRQRY
ncbi:MAG: RNA-binding protein [Chitinivibrionales bacterium]|nr:RNA-binding protein [Chitinivibrionales bacterium]